jgi:hypothetical protein
LSVAIQQNFAVPKFAVYGVGKSEREAGEKIFQGCKQKALWDHVWARLASQRPSLFALRKVQPTNAARIKHQRNKKNRLKQYLGIGLELVVNRPSTRGPEIMPQSATMLFIDF